MGAGAAACLGAAVAKSNDDELKAVLGAMGKQDRKKLADALAACRLAKEKVTLIVKRKQTRSGPTAPSAWRAGAVLL